jgi:hypothetical protein
MSYTNKGVAFPYRSLSPTLVSMGGDIPDALTPEQQECARAMIANGSLKGDRCKSCKANPDGTLKRRCSKHRNWGK